MPDLTAPELDVSGPRKAERPGSRDSNAECGPHALDSCRFCREFGGFPRAARLLRQSLARSLGRGRSNDCGGMSGRDLSEQHSATGRTHAEPPETLLYSWIFQTLRG